MDPDPLSLLTFIFALILVGLSAASEGALAMVNRSQIRQMSAQGVRRATTVDALLSNTSRFLATFTLLKTIALVVIGISLIDILPELNGLWFTLMIGIICFVVVMVHLLGRAFVLSQPLPIALQVAPFVSFFSQLFFPLTSLMYRLILLIGGEKNHSSDENIFLSEDGLRLLIDVNDEEPIHEAEKQMIVSILEMDETVAREIMVPRIDIVALDANTNLSEALDVIIQAGHSRIPVYEENVDHVIGMLYAKDLLQCFRENRADGPIRDLLREVHFVPYTKTVDILFREMQKQRVHIAIVVDEYGGTAGLITIEDLLEEIVGEIQDEYDEEMEEYIQSVETDRYVINARLDISSLSELLSTQLEINNADTLGGLIYSQLGHVPEPGESVDFAGWRFVVISVDEQRIDQIKVEPIYPLPIDESATFMNGNTIPNHDSQSLISHSFHL